MNHLSNTMPQCHNSSTTPEVSPDIGHSPPQSQVEVDGAEKSKSVGPHGEARATPTPGPQPNSDLQSLNDVLQSDPADEAPSILPLDPNPHLDSTIPNIVVFGETGTGKSSIINMLDGNLIADVSSGASGCTFHSRPYEVRLKSDDTPNLERTYRLWDTSGLNEGTQGTIPAKKSLRNLIELVTRLSSSEGGAGGVNLLVYCIRGARLREIVRVNYDLFWGIICQKMVPIVLVITGLENEENMESWWDSNGQELTELGMAFEGHACVTATRGKVGRGGDYLFAKEYADSEAKVRRLVETTVTDQPLRLEGKAWMADITSRLKTYMKQYNLRTGREREHTELFQRNDASHQGWKGWVKHLLEALIRLVG